MIKYRNKRVKIKSIDVVICDKCKTEITDELELQEVLHIDFFGGYSSIFGDGALVKCDLCQKCLHEMIKDFCDIT